MLPLSTTVPWPAAGGTKLAMVSGVSLSGSLSLASTLMVIGTPALVLTVSATASGFSLPEGTSTMPVTLTGSLSAPPAADLTVTLSGGWLRSLTTSVPSAGRGPYPWATRPGFRTLSLELAVMVRRRLAGSY
ncbi:hypothetical protein D3C71_1423130 [compost metagenome]